MAPRAWMPAVVCVLTLAMAAPREAGAADVRIGYIDSARIFQEYKVAQDAQLEFDRKVESWRTQSVEKENLINQLRAEVRDQTPILSTLKRQEKEEALQRAISDYERFVQDIWGPQGRAVQENEQATGAVVAQIRSAVEKVATDKGLSLVLDAAGGFIVWADRTLDLTSEVLQELAARLEAGTAR
jgi:Skp family chaperone for outer membrane proteins